MVGDGVFGPFEDDAVVKELPPFKIEDDPSEPSEPTRGDEVPDEYACCGWGKGREGNLSLTYDVR
jgi:hypothetical protein